jgi:hypothetical protein
MLADQDHQPSTEKHSQQEGVQLLASLPAMLNALGSVFERLGLASAAHAAMNAVPPGDIRAMHASVLDVVVHEPDEGQYESESCDRHELLQPVGGHGTVVKTMSTQ